MSVTQEEGGRLNAFAKEPSIEVITQDSSRGNAFQVLAISAIVFIIGLIVFAFTMT